MKTEFKSIFNKHLDNSTLTSRDLASEMKVHESNMRSYKIGKMTPTLENLKMLSKLFKLNKKDELEFATSAYYSNLNPKNKALLNWVKSLAAKQSVEIAREYIVDKYNLTELEDALSDEHCIRALRTFHKLKKQSKEPAIRLLELIKDSSKEKLENILGLLK